MSACMTASRKRTEGVSLEVTPLQIQRISYEPNAHLHALLFAFLHIHPGALQCRREELLPVFPPKWKELSTIITIFCNQKLSPLHWHRQQWPCSALWWLIHSSTALDAVTSQDKLWNVNWGGLSVGCLRGTLCKGWFYNTGLQKICSQSFKKKGTTLSCRNCI